MSIREQRCPECEKVMQHVTAGNTVLLVCACGHAEDAATQDEPQGMVRYVQEVGRQTLTRIMEPRGH